MAGSTIDNETIIQADRILVKAQNTKSENGIYIVNNGTGLTRADDFVTGTASGGDFVFVDAGTNNGKSGFVVVGDFNINVGSVVIEFTKFTMSNVTPFGNSLIASDASNARSTLGLTLGSGGSLAADDILQAKQALGNGNFLKMDGSKVITRDAVQIRGDLDLTFGAISGNILPNGEALTDGEIIRVSGTTMISRSAVEARDDLGITLGLGAGNILQIDSANLVDGQLLKVDGGKMQGITIGLSAGDIPQIGSTDLTNNLFLKVDSTGKLATVSDDILGAKIGAVRTISETLTMLNSITGATNVKTLTVPTGYIATKIGYFVTHEVLLANSAGRISLKIGNDSQDDRFLTQTDITSSATLPGGQFEKFHLSFPFVAAGTSELQLKNKIDGNSAEPGFTGFSNMTMAARLQGKKFKLTFINNGSSHNTTTIGELQVFLEIMPMQQS